MLRDNLIALREIINASDVSSFELQHSGIVTSLLIFLTHESPASKTPEPTTTAAATEQPPSQPTFSMTTRRHSKQIMEEGGEKQQEQNEEEIYSRNKLVSSYSKSTVF